MEKLFCLFEVGVVFVVMGLLVVKDWMLNEKFVIFVDDFKYLKDFVEFIKYFNINDIEYVEYMNYKDFKYIINKFLFKMLEERLWYILGEWDKVNFGYWMYVNFECYVCDCVIEW